LTSPYIGTFNYGVAILPSMAAVEIRIELKKGVADPEGGNTKKTLESLGFLGVKSVRSVKVFEMELEMDPEAARVAADDMCRKLLANPVIQNYSITVR